MRKETGPEPKSRACSTTPPSADEHATDELRQELLRLRLAWRRRAWLACGCSESCRCDDKRHPSAKRTEAYRQAIEHLADSGLAAAALTPELRGLWRSGGSDRQLAESIARRWTA